MAGWDTSIEARATAATLRVPPWVAPGIRVALAHDYLSERGGAERVVVALTRAFPGAPLYTSVFERSRFPELADVDVRSSSLNQVRLLRENHRLALPLLPRAFGRFDVEADVVVCSSSGWAHGINTSAPKVVYCYNPPRWLYQRREYIRTRRRYAIASAGTRRFLLDWDQQAAASCERYIAISRLVAARIKRHYGVEAEVIPPPTTFDRDGAREPIEGIEPGFVLSVSRLLAYKNVHTVAEAFAELRRHQLVIVGDGAMRPEIERIAGRNVRFVGKVNDAQLRWLYSNCAGLVSASYEDFGLTPVEAALFGKPSALLRAGGFVDTAVEGVTGVFFDEPNVSDIVTAVRELLTSRWDPEAIAASAERFSEAGFARRLHAVVNDVAGGGSSVPATPAPVPVGR